MKVCKICSVEKPLEHFSFHQKSKNTRRPECRECYNRLRREKGDPSGKRKETNRKSYQKNKVARKREVIEYQKKNPEKVHFWKKRARKKKAIQFHEWKSQLSCESCGENHPACLEFHHIDPSQKEGLITKMRFSPNKLSKELPKCRVLCSNCHRKLHYKEKLSYVQHEEKTIIRHSCKEEGEKPS